MYIRNSLDEASIYLLEGHFLIETQIMLSRLYENLQRKKQIQILKKNCSHLGNIRIGIANHFTIYPQIKSLNLGKDINFRNYIHLIVQNNAELIIGNRVFLNNFCSINCLEKIEIGDNTLFGENVKIYDHNHDYQTQPEFEVFHSKFKTAAVKIGKNCWLGSNVVVLKGVTIGDNCIIGAGCIIFKDIPDNTTVINQQDLILKPRG